MPTPTFYRIKIDHLHFFLFLPLLLLLICGCQKGETENDRAAKSLAHYTPIEIPDLYVILDEDTFSVNSLELVQLPFAVKVMCDNLEPFLVHLNNKGEPTGRVSGSLNGAVFDASDFSIKTTLETNTQLAYTYELSGTVGNHTLTVVVSAIEEGWGKTVFEVQNGVAYLSGVIGYSTWNDLLALNKNHPEVDHIVFQDIPGSVADPINFKIGYTLRKAGYTTEALSDSFIASGGVDLFLAGNQRTIPKEWSNEQTFGFFVHGWCCTSTGVEPAELPRDAIEHKPYLEYSKAMLGDVLGEDFYFFTLAAAPSDEIHRMTDQELTHFQISAQ